MLERFKWSLLKSLSLLGLVLIASESLAFAEPVPLCSTGTVADIMNTTCAIGNLQFTFQSYDSAFFDGDMTTGHVTSYGGLNSASVNFAPLGVSGFVLIAPELSVRSTGNYIQTFQVVLRYTVFAAEGYVINDEHTSHDGTFSISGSGRQALAQYLGTTSYFAFDSYCLYCQVADGHAIVSEFGNVSEINSHTMAIQTGRIGMHGGNGFAMPLHINAWDGGSASMGGSTNFLYDTEYVPELSSLVLLCIGLAGIGAMRIKKSAIPDRHL